MTPAEPETVDGGDSDAVERAYAALSPPERSRVDLEATLAGDLPDEWVRAAIDEYGEEYGPAGAVRARIGAIDTNETLTVEVDVEIDPPLFKRAWLRYEAARWNGTADARTFESIMFDYVEFRPRFEVTGPLHDIGDLLVPGDDTAEGGEDADGDWA